MNLMNMNSQRGGSQPPILNLQKNQVLDLTKVAPSLENIVLGAGWDVASYGPSMDLDIAAFLVSENGRVLNPAEDVIFFNHMRGKGIRLEGDNLTGEGDGDDERIQVKLSKIAPHVDKIVFFVTIFNAQEKKQTFGMVNNSFIRLLDADNDEREILRYELKERCSSSTALTFAELERTGNGWQFKAIGEGSIGDLNTLITNYI